MAVFAFCTAVPQPALGQQQLPSLSAQVPTSPDCSNCLTSTTTGTLTINYSWTATSGSISVSGSAPGDAKVTSVYLVGPPTGQNVRIGSISLSHLLWTDTIFQTFTDGTVWYPTSTVSKTTPWAGQFVNEGTWVATPEVLESNNLSTLQMSLVIRWSAPASNPTPHISGAIYVRPTGNLVVWARDDNNPAVAPQIAWRFDDSNPNPPFESVFPMDKQFRPFTADEMAFLGISAPSDAAWTGFGPGTILDGKPHTAYAYIQDTQTGAWVRLPGTPAQVCIAAFEGTSRSVPCDNTLITDSSGKRFAVVAGTKFEFKSDSDYQFMTQFGGPYHGSPLQRVTAREVNAIPSTPPERPTFGYYLQGWGFKIRGGERVPVSYELLAAQGGYSIPPHSLDNLPLRPLRLYSWNGSGWGREADIPLRILGRPAVLTRADGSVIVFGRGENDTLLQSQQVPGVGWMTNDTGVPMKTDPSAVLLPNDVIKVFSRIGADELIPGAEGVELQVATWNAGWQVERVDFPGGLYGTPAAVAVGDVFWLYGSTYLNGQRRGYQLSYVPQVGWESFETATMDGRPAIHIEGDLRWFYSAKKYETSFMQQVSWTPEDGWQTFGTPVSMQGEPAVVVEGPRRWFYSRHASGLMQQAAWDPSRGGWVDAVTVPVPLEYDPVVWTKGISRYFVTH